MDKAKLVVLWLGVLLASAAPTIARAKAAPPSNRVPIQAARKAARKAYAGQINSEELEFEGGRWLYSFDMKKPSDKNVHEVHIDAVSGKLLSVHTESAADEQKEARSEHSESKHD